MSGERVSREQALELLRSAPTAELIARAEAIRFRRHCRRTYFTHSLNLNPTNICENRCELCAFWREPDAADAYCLDLEQVRRRFEQVRDWGLTDLHVVGGVSPRLNLAYYESLIALARRMLPGVLVQGLTAVEIHYLAQQEKLTAADVLRRLMAAGLGAMPGGGAEIFREGVRRRICSKKISGEQWLAVHEQAHGRGLPSNATMLFGHVETDEDIVDHLGRLRDVQDRTGGFQAFIPLPFHPRGARVEGAAGPSGDRVARVVSLARIFLDNFPHVRALAYYLDRKLLHVLTYAGADDVGPTSIDERIAHAAGASADLRVESVKEMEAMLADLGLEPVLVNSVYHVCSDAVRRFSFPRRRETPYGVATNVGDILARAEAGERLSAAEAVALHDRAGLGELGQAAQRRRMRVIPERTATFVIDRNISLTNVCEAHCLFCAFHVPVGSPKGFVLSVEQIVELVEQAEGQGATQVLIQGGLNPDLDLAFYEKVLRAIKQRCRVWLHSLSPAEVLYLATRVGLSIEQTLGRLREAGLDSLPGGGAEILVDEVRRRVSPRKLTAGQWLAVMETAQRMGMLTTATMVYGLGETPAQRVGHLLAVRELQDRTGGFTAFIPWSCQTNQTRIALRPCTGVDYLRMVALSRLVLDNVPHVQAGWVTEGPDVAQLALSFGADDFGGVLMEERVVRATGLSHAVTVGQVVELIRQAGYLPVQRTTRYEKVRAFDGSDAG